MPAGVGSRTDRVVAAALVPAAVVAQMAVMGRASVGLDVGLVVAWAVWLRAPTDWAAGRGHVARIYRVGIGVQCLHFVEEYATGFQREFPGLFGYAWSDARFAAFNLVWLAIFAAAAVGLGRGSRLALLPVWFFALAGGVGNGVMHLLAVAARRGYFPGAVTAPLLLAVGVALVRALAVPAPRPPAVPA